MKSLFQRGVVAAGLVAGPLAGASLGSPILASPSQIIDRAPLEIIEAPAGFASHMALFGVRVGIAGGDLVVSQPSGGPPNSGFVAIWRQTPHGYQESQVLFPAGCFVPTPPGSQSPGGITSCGFGRWIGTSDDYIVVRTVGGDPSSQFGRLLLHVYRREQGAWVLDEIIREPASLVNPNASGGGSTGPIVFQGDRMAVGAGGFEVPGEVSLGAIMVYERLASGVWIHTDTLRAPAYSGPATNSVGALGRSSLAWSGEYLVSSEPLDRALVHVFRQSGSGFTLMQTIPRSSPTPLGFAEAIAVDGHAGVLAFSDYASARVLVYELQPAGNWVQVAQLGAAEPNSGPFIGGSLAVRGDVLAVGSHLARLQGAQTGVVDIYRRGPNGWALERRVGPPHSPLTGGWDAELFGGAVFLRNGTLIVGAPGWAPVVGYYPGRAYMYELSSGTPVCDGTGNPLDLNVLLDDEPGHDVQLSVFGLSGHGFGYFTAGTANTPHQVGQSEWCVGRPRRISPLLDYASPADRLYWSAPHPDPTAPWSTVFQFLYWERGPSPHQAASVARVVD